MADEPRFVVAGTSESAGLVSEALRLSLTEKEKYKKNRTPYGLDQALEHLSSADHWDPSLVFLKADARVWYAYFRATRRDESIKHHASMLPIPTLERIAAETLKITPHESVSRHSDHVFHYSTRSRKRAKLLSSIIARWSLAKSLHGPSQHSDPLSPSDALVTDAEAMARSDLDVGVDPVQAARQQERSSAHRSEEEEDPGTTPALMDEPHGDFAWPKAKHLPLVFPHYLCTAILKRDDQASVSVSFPSDTAQCCLFFLIQPAEVQHMARELFGVFIRVMSKRRYVYLDHGANIEIEGCIKLRGTTGASVGKLLGDTVSLAFKHGPKRSQELSMGEMSSQALTMTIWDGEDSPGQFAILMERECLSQIYHQLWQEDTTSLTSCPS